MGESLWRVGPQPRYRGVCHATGAGDVGRLVVAPPASLGPVGAASALAGVPCERRGFGGVPAGRAHSPGRQVK